MFSVFLILLVYIRDVHGQGQQGAIRLAGTNSTMYMGRVEVFHNGQWGTVCDEGFDGADAVVACRQLGFLGEGVQIVLNWPAQQQGFGAGTGMIWMSGMQCTGTEPSLFSCTFNGFYTNPSNCTHTKDVGVDCTPRGFAGSTVQPTSASISAGYGQCTYQSSSPQNVRLVGPSNQRQLGVVQINVPGTGWMTACDNNWNLMNAQVVCRMLCYNTPVGLPGGASFSISSILEPVMQDWIDCRGNENNVANCPTITSYGCQAHEKAQVDCDPGRDFTSQQSPLNCTLDCEQGLIRATFFQLGASSSLQCRSFRLHNTNYIGPCTFGCQTNNNRLDVTITMPLDECGTFRTGNATHLLYSNSLSYEPSSGTNPWSITRESLYRLDLVCALPRAYTPNRPWDSVSKNILHEAPGLFNVTMAYYTDRTFQLQLMQSPLMVEMGVGLHAALELHVIDRDTRLVVTDCFATPTASFLDPNKYYLFQDKCIVDPTTSLFPLTNFDFGFHFEVFRFLHQSLVYLHCNCTVCGVDEPWCDQSCPLATAGRRKRSVTDTTFMVNGPVIMVYKKDEDTDPSDPPEPDTDQATGFSSNTELEFDQHDPRNPSFSESNQESVQLRKPVGSSTALLPGYLLQLVTLVIYGWWMSGIYK